MNSNPATNFVGVAGGGVFRVGLALLTVGMVMSSWTRMKVGASGLCRHSGGHLLHLLRLDMATFSAVMGQSGSLCDVVHGMSP